MKRTRPTPKNAESLLEAAKLSNAEARFLVSNYLDVQERRKRADLQLRHLGEKDEANADHTPKTHGRVLYLEAENWVEMEKLLQKHMAAYVDGNPIGRWITSLHGVGPVIGAGLLAHIDITRAKTAGSVWRYAGLDPSLKWAAGEKRPYNAALKQVCFHFGECQVKVSNHPDAFYGRLYRTKKAELIARNDRGGFAEKAAAYKGVTDPANKKLLKEGKVPPGYIDKMARRFATKIFLSHLHAIMHFCEHRTVPPPFAHAHLGHIHLLDVPNAAMFPGFIEAYRGDAGRLQAAE